MRFGTRRPPVVDKGRRPRLTCVIDSLEQGGAQRQLSMLAALLTRRGWHVDVVTYRRTRFFDSVLEASGVAVHCLSESGRLRRSLAIRRAIRDRDPDAVVAYLRGPRRLRGAGGAAPAPIQVDCHGIRRSRWHGSPGGSSASGGPPIGGRRRHRDGPCPAAGDRGGPRAGGPDGRDPQRRGSTAIPAPERPGWTGACVRRRRRDAGARPGRLPAREEPLGRARRHGAPAPHRAPRADRPRLVRDDVRRRRWSPLPRAAPGGARTTPRRRLQAARSRARRAVALPARVAGLPAVVLGGVFERDLRGRRERRAAGRFGRLRQRGLRGRRRHGLSGRPPRAPRPSARRFCASTACPMPRSTRWAGAPGCTPRRCSIRNASSTATRH